MGPVFPLKRHSITFRLTMAVCVFLILFQTALALVIYHYFKREFKETISQQQFTLLTVVTRNIDQKLLSCRQVVEGVASLITPEIAADADAVQRLLDNRAGTHRLFDNGIFLFSADGKIIAESPFREGRRGRDIAFREYFTRTMKTGLPVISEPYLSTHTPGAPAIMFTAPVKDGNGRIIAILGASLNLQNDNFLGELSRTRIAENGYLYIVNNSRTMLMHPDKSRIMQSPEIVGSNKLLDAAFNGFEGTNENVNSRGLHSLTSFKRFKNTDWIMGANYPLAEAYAPIYHFQRYLIIAILLSAFLSVVIVRILMERFTRTLVRFTEHVRMLPSKKNYDRLFQAEADGEIGFLAGTFNAMVQREDQKSEELVYASTHDAMTGLYNRAYFDGELDRLSRGRLSPVSIVVADIDGLKNCNDTAGHAAGDELIRSAARILVDSFRAEDIIARIGGDEFGVLLPGVDAEQARMALERVRSSESKMVSEPGGCPLRISLGQSTCENPGGLQETFKQADSQMYRDKVTRRNRLS